MTKGYEAVKRIRVAKRAYINDWKLSGCNFCGEKDTIVLEAHHLDPKTKHGALKKSKTAKQGLYGLSWKDLEEELQKCIVLCANCHRRETHRQRLIKGVM